MQQQSLVPNINILVKTEKLTAAQKIAYAPIDANIWRASEQNARPDFATHFHLVGARSSRFERAYVHRTHDSNARASQLNVDIVVRLCI